MNTTRLEEMAVGNRTGIQPREDRARANTHGEPQAGDPVAMLARYPQLRQIVELFDHLEDVMAWIKDHENRFCWVNRAVLMMQANDGQELDAADASSRILGKTDHDFVPTPLADQYRMDDEYALAGNRVVNRIELFRRSDGTTGWHVTNKIPLFDDRGTVIGTAGIAQWLNTPNLDMVPGQEFAGILTYMGEHYHLHVSNQQLAQLAHLSVRAFERKFHASFHLTPQKYLRNLRMRIASHALVYTNQLLAEVATRCGFADQSHFTREFRRHFGWTPREYREHFSKQGAIAVPGTRIAAGKQA